MKVWTCPSCTEAGRRGYCAPNRCYCAHGDCHAAASYEPRREPFRNVTPLPARTAKR